MSNKFKQFLASEDGAITVDYVVLSAAAVAMAISTTDVLDDTIDFLSSRLEAQLRNQQISDAFVQFDSAFWQGQYDDGTFNETQTEDYFNQANELMNQELIDKINELTPAAYDGTLTTNETGELIAAISVGLQRNIFEASDLGDLMTTLGLDGYA